MQIKELKYYGNVPCNWKKLLKYELLVLPKMKKLPTPSKKLWTCWPFRKFPDNSQTFLFSLFPWHFPKFPDLEKTPIFFPPLFPDAYEPYLCHTITSNWQLPFLNQQKG